MGASRGDRCRHRELSCVGWKPKCPKIKSRSTFDPPDHVSRVVVRGGLPEEVTLELNLRVDPLKKG